MCASLGMTPFGEITRSALKMKNGSHFNQPRQLLCSQSIEHHPFPLNTIRFHSQPPFTFPALPGRLEI